MRCERSDPRPIGARQPAAVEADLTAAFATARIGRAMRIVARCRVDATVIHPALGEIVPRHAIFVRRAVGKDQRSHLTTLRAPLLAVSKPDYTFTSSSLAVKDREITIHQRESEDREA